MVPVFTEKYRWQEVQRYGVEILSCFTGTVSKQPQYGHSLLSCQMMSSNHLMAVLSSGNISNNFIIDMPSRSERPGAKEERSDLGEEGVDGLDGKLSGLDGLDGLDGKLSGLDGLDGLDGKLSGLDGLDGDEGLSDGAARPDLGDGGLDGGLDGLDCGTELSDV